MMSIWNRGWTRNGADGGRWKVGKVEGVLEGMNRTLLHLLSYEGQAQLRSFSYEGQATRGQGAHKERLGEGAV